MTCAVHRTHLTHECTQILWSLHMKMKANTGDIHIGTAASSTFFILSSSTVAQQTRRPSKLTCSGFGGSAAISYTVQGGKQNGSIVSASFQLTTMVLLDFLTLKMLSVPFTSFQRSRMVTRPTSYHIPSFGTPRRMTKTGACSM